MAIKARSKGHVHMRLDLLSPTKSRDHYLLQLTLTEPTFHVIEEKKLGSEAIGMEWYNHWKRKWGLVDC